MDETAARVTLPVRLIPDRTSALGLVLLFPTIGVFVLWGFVSDVVDGWQRIGLWRALTDEPGMMIALGIGLAVLLWMETVAILRALPKSPFFYLEISADGLKRRDLTKEKSIAWAKIEKLNLVERMQRNGKTRKMHWWILAETDQWAEDHDVDRRIKQALLAYDTDELSPAFSSSKEVAGDLLAVLRELRSSVGKGSKDVAVSLPATLRRVAISAVPAAAPVAGKVMTKARPKPRSVIER